MEHEELQSAPHDPQNGKLNVSALILGVLIALFEIGISLDDMELQSALMIPQNEKPSVSFIVWVGMYCIT